MVAPVQAVVTDGEKLAVELADLLVDGKKDEALAALSKYAKARRLAYWEVVAIADIARRMSVGRRWKKD